VTDACTTVANNSTAQNALHRPTRLTARRTFFDLWSIRNDRTRAAGDPSSVRGVWGSAAQRRQPVWEQTLRNEEMPFADRLFIFYKGYTAATNGEHWLRLFAFAGLQGEPQSARYMASISERVINSVAVAPEPLPGGGGNSSIASRRRAPSARSLELGCALNGQMSFSPSGAKHSE
jgi:hypothetical protein